MIYASLQLEESLWLGGKEYICGIDEVGRGCFAGPVVAGAVIFPKNCELIKGLADSKLLNAKKRKELEKQIKELALYWSVGTIGVEEINEFGIGRALQMAYLEAIKSLKQQPEYVLMDAFLIKDFDKSKQQAVVNGDTLCASIAAASIVAKVFRDELMNDLENDFPGYGFSKHKGYGTKLHQDAIKRLGLCKLHRTSFNLRKFL